MSNYKFGAIQSPKDIKNYISQAIIPCDIILEREFNWYKQIPYIIDQGQFGTCVGCSASAKKNVQEVVDNNYPDGGFSILFNYTMCKKSDGIPDVEGTYPKVSMEVMKKYGALPEKDLPYDLLTNITKLPNITNQMIEKAKPYKIATYAEVATNDLIGLKQAIKLSPVMFSIFCTESFLEPENGFISKPEGWILGGHAITIIGWDDDLEHTYSNGKTEKGFVIVQNSWGKNWGNNGFAYIPYSLLTWKTGDNFFEFIMEIWSSIDVKNSEILKKYYKVQTGAFRVKDNAINLVEDLKKKGFSTYIPPIDNDGLYRVQVGAFSIKDNAKKMKIKLIESGYKDAFIVYK